MLQHLPPISETRRLPSILGVQAAMDSARQYSDQEPLGCRSTIDLGRSPSDYHVLVVHHQSETINMISSMFRMAGYRKITAKNSAKEIKNIKHIHCDLLFSELEMPILDGHSLACLYKNYHPQAKALMMTCRCQAEIVDLTRDGIVDGWLHKPFNINTLHNKLMDLLPGRDETCVNCMTKTQHHCENFNTPIKAHMIKEQR